MRKFIIALSLLLTSCAVNPKVVLAPGRDLAGRVSPGVFMALSEDEDGQVGGGTAFCAPGALPTFLVTAGHVARPGLWVVGHDGVNYPATIMKHDEEVDIAVLKVDAEICAGVTFEMARENAAPGTEATLFGFGGLLLKPLVTHGNIASVKGAAKNLPLLQVANLNGLFGHSGSPVFDNDGRIIGMLVGGFNQGDEMDTIVPVDEIRKALR